MIAIEMGPPGTDLVPAPGLAPTDEAALRRAIAELRRSSLAMRLTALLGRQLGAISFAVPSQISEAVNKSAEAAIRHAMALALKSLATAEIRDRSRLHKSVATLAGAAGGAIGLAGLPLELPFTTTVMLRSIADIAQSEGEDLSDPDVAIACLEVFALGSDQQHPADSIEAGSAVDTGYFAVRVLLAKSITQSAKRFLQSGLSDQTAPLMVRLITLISSRFGLVVSQKLAAQAVPIIGAASGAAINYAFVDHFQALARGHFTVRRLERIYGPAQVRAEYDRLAAQI